MSCALVAGSNAAAQEKTYRLPLFRHVEAASEAPAPPAEPIRLLADADFPPFSFVTATGKAAGIAVDLALAACSEAKMRCEVATAPYPTLLGGLSGRNGEAVISGPRLEPAALATALPTRPYFRNLGRFAVITGSPLKAADVRSLGGKRIGAIKNSAHRAWLQAYYSRSTLVDFSSEAEAQEALRTGTIDALFGDALRIIYWIVGSSSRGCCKLLDGAYVDRDYFSRGMVFLVRRDRDDVRAAFDYGLDRLQNNGTTEKIFNTYVPLNPW
jgi:polar amino acid transport system substrate-binding protein